MKYPFKVSTGLKDLIGRDLITDDFVAVFELVKNSFDAHASSAWVRFDADRIIVSDDGKGMSHADIINKWLFVAYSAKRDNSEDDDYRDTVSRRRMPFAGAKGIGRFSCDRLGQRLLLSSRAADEQVQILEVDWTRYEEDSKREFSTVPVDLSQAPDFPDPTTKRGRDVGTVLEIRDLRSSWGRDKILRLKRELAKLIKPLFPWRACIQDSGIRSGGERRRQQPTHPSSSPRLSRSRHAPLGQRHCREQHTQCTQAANDGRACLHY